MFCASCGTKLSEQEIFCASCGAKKINKSAVQHAPNENPVSTTPIPNVVVAHATFGPLTVQQNMLSVNGKVYGSQFRRKKVNQTFKSNEITVSTDRLRGIWPRKGVVISLIIGLFLFFLWIISNSSQMVGGGT
jgi:uncharacterized membrane protein YvbJ